MAKTRETAKNNPVPPPIHCVPDLSNDPASVCVYPPSETAFPQATSLDPSWLMHKTTQQIVWNPLFATAQGARTLQQYRTYVARYQQNPNDPIFRDPAVALYQSTTATGKAAESVMIPQEFRGRPLSRTDQENLRASGARAGTVAANTMVVANGVSLVGNALAFAECTREENCDATAMSAIA